MKFVAFTLMGCLLLSLWLSSCANKGVITGGEKDTIPPEMLSTVPFNQSLNYKGTEIVLTFNERVQAPQLQRKLLITPFTDTKYKVKVNKNIVQLSFEESFADSTTFTLNFADAITDVTESNPGQNIVIAFSTWDIIDSLQVAGKITDLLTNEPIEAASVSIYEANDTLDIFTGKPYYFAITDEFGIFSIQNMRGGRYRMYAFKDDNSNYLNEPTAEAHGFIRDTLEIGLENDSIYIPLIYQDVQEFKLINMRANGSHFDVRYNKYVNHYSLQPLEEAVPEFPTAVVSENQVVRFYQKPMRVDSLPYLLTAGDSVGNQLVDTVYVKFTDRRLNLSEMEVELNPPNGASIDEAFQFQLKFNKPIASVNWDSLLFKYDTLRTDRVDSIGSLSWNWNRTEAQIDVVLDRDFLKLQQQLADQLADSLDRADTVTVDSLKVPHKRVKLAVNKVKFYAGRGAFVSVEQDSSKVIQPNYEFRQADKFGKISGQITIDSVYFVVQLINKDFEKIQESENTRNYQFDFVPPGKYNIRVLVDDNNDGVWSFGNIKKGIPPEPVYFHPSFIELRENWEINNINLTIER